MSKLRSNAIKYAPLLVPFTVFVVVTVFTYTMLLVMNLLSLLFPWHP
jgi:hypothetical protein